MRQKGSNQSIVKKTNSQLIREVLYDYAPISRTDIASIISLSLPTVTTNISELIASGIVVDLQTTEEETRHSGRKPQLLEYSLDYGYYLGIELGPYSTYAVITDLRGGIIFSKEHSPAPELYVEMMDYLKNIVINTIKESEVGKSKIIGVGVCLPGYIDASKDVIYMSMRHDWNNKHIAKDLASLVSLPVHIENNVRSRAIAYDLFNQGPTPEVLVYYFVAYGISCAVMINRNLIYGMSAGSGEIGHVVINPNGPKCNLCGNNGCLEVMAGEKAILRQCTNRLNSGIPSFLSSLVPDINNLDIKDVLTAQKCEDKLSLDVVGTAIEHIGSSISSILGLLSPDALIVDSRLFIPEANQSQLLKHIPGSIYGTDFKKSNIIFLDYDVYRGAVGAAATAIKTFFLKGE